jgi:hypothetical protein
MKKIRKKERKKEENISQQDLLTSMVFSKYTKARDVALALAEDSPYWPLIANSCVLRSLRDELISCRSESN